MDGASIIVCCYNSQDVIASTLEHLSKQKRYKDYGLEVVLVDNNSNDNTRDIATRTWREVSTPFPLVMVHEAKQGLSFARSTGLRNARYETIIFCDDDNWLSNEYAARAIEFLECHPEVGVVGGHNLGVLDGPEPSWWRERAEGYAVGKQGTCSGDISDRMYVWGAGMVIRKCIIEKLQAVSFDSLLSDRRGQDFASGGDTEISFWALLLGYRLWYLESLSLQHFIAKERLRHEYVTKLFHGLHAAHLILRWYEFFLKKRHYYQHLGFLDRLIRISRCMVAVFKFGVKDEYLLADVQMQVGTLVKVHPTLFKILRTYKRVVN